MLPWLLVFMPSTKLEPMRTQFQTVVSQKRAAMETIEVRRTAGIQVQVGDRVTVHYRFRQGEVIFMDSERMGVQFTFTIGQSEVPDVFEMAVSGLQRGGYRKAVIQGTSLGEEFLSRWPSVKSDLTLEVTLVEISRIAP